MLVPTILNIALNIILLPRIGLMGAVVATVTAYGVGMVLLAIVGRRHLALPIPFWETVKIGIACLIMAAVVLVAPSPGGILEIVLKAVLGGVAYGCSAILLNLADVRTRLLELMSRLPKQGTI